MPQNDIAEHMKRAYPIGSKIIVHYMDDPRPVKPGSIGTVEHIDDIGTLHCTFEDGRYLGVMPGVDSFSKFTPPELNHDDGAR